MQTNGATKTSARQKELTGQFLTELNKHLEDLKQGKVTRAYELNDFAAIMHVHPVHLSNTVRHVTGKSPCDLYEDGLLDISRQLLADRSRSIGDIARTLTYDPSNFTKFFKRFAGVTPKQYRESIL